MLILGITEFVEPIVDQAPRLLINNLIIIALFLLGIGAGALLLRIIYLIASKKVYKKERKVEKVEDSEIYDGIIIPALQAYDTEYGGAKLGEKFEGFKKAFVFMLNNISKAYYPKSDYPMFEVSPDELLKLADNVADKICRQLKRFLDDNFIIRNAFKAGVYMHNKGKKDILSYDWREIKLSTVKTLLENVINKSQVEEKEKKNFFDKVGATVKALPNKLFNSFISSKIRELIVETGMEIDKVYGGKHDKDESKELASIDAAEEK